MAIRDNMQVVRIFMKIGGKKTEQSSMRPSEQWTDMPDCKQHFDFFTTDVRTNQPMDGEAFPQRYEIASKDDLKTVVKFGWLKNFVYIILWSFVNMCRHTTAATAAAVAADHDQFWQKADTYFKLF